MAIRETTHAAKTVDYTNKRWLACGHRYVVDFTCPSCGKVHTVALAGWSAIKCSNCPTWCERGSYLKAGSAS